MAKGKSRKSASGSHTTAARKREQKAARADKRKLKRTIGSVAIAALVLALGTGVLYASNLRGDRARDLSEIGSGVPAVVQVHDVTCPVCSELRSTVRRIQSDFSDSELLIRIADIHTDEGLAFAERYTTARRQTLLFIDASGELLYAQVGLQDESDLRQAFEQHAVQGR